MSIRPLISILLLSLVLPAPAVAQELYDTVILGGRVIDPETGRDEIANVGILADQIRAITTDDIQGRLRRASASKSNSIKCLFETWVGPKRIE